MTARGLLTDARATIEDKRVQFGYGLNYLIDIENAVIVDVEATPARTYDEAACAKNLTQKWSSTMVDS